jgi:hypothetical protein
MIRPIHSLLKRYGRIGACAVLGLFVATAGRPEPVETWVSTWGRAYLWSHIVDFCFDQAAGRTMREAIRQLIRDCPISGDDRDYFASQAEFADREYHAHPGRLGSMVFDCAKIQPEDREKIERTSTKMSRFRHGEITASQALDATCP